MGNFRGNILYIIAVLLAFIWAVSFYGYNVGGGIHLLLIISIIAAYVSIWKVDPQIRRKA